MSIIYKNATRKTFLQKIEFFEAQMYVNKTSSKYNQPCIQISELVLKNCENEQTIDFEKM